MKKVVTKVMINVKTTMEKKAMTMMVIMTTKVHLKVKVKVMTTPVNRRILRKNS